MNEFLQSLKEFALSGGIRILAIAVGAFIVIRIFRVIIRRSKAKFETGKKGTVEGAKRAETLSGLIETTIRVAVLIAAFLMVL
jgi:small-conductance mechanosensitive channel